MKKIRLYIEEILVHICVALSIACISFKFLDWYNPYMDFEGHTVVLHYLLYFGCTGTGNQPDLPAERETKTCRAVRKKY